MNIYIVVILLLLSGIIITYFFKRSSKKEYIDLEMDDKGNVLPTKHNGDIIGNLITKHSDNLDKVIETIGKKNWSSWLKNVMFDPRNKNVFYNTPEDAINAAKRAKSLNKLDEKYIAEKEQN